jgi:hypothetical protein
MCLHAEALRPMVTACSMSHISALIPKEPGMPSIAQKCHISVVLKGSYLMSRTSVLHETLYSVTVTEKGLGAGRHTSSQ